MSTRFCLLLSAVFPFNEEHLRSEKTVFDLPRRLQSFIALVYHLPDSKVEGSEAMDVLSDVDNMRRRGGQHRAAQLFMKGASEVFEEDPDLGAELNKPNVHRFIVLCVQTITSFGHAKNCSEMILEMAHRKFKGWLETNSHASSHLSGMERAIASDWQGRVCAMAYLLENGSELERGCAIRCLLRLIVGEEALSIDLSSRSGYEFGTELEKDLLVALRDPVLKEMELITPLNDLSDRFYQWEARNLMTMVEEDETMQEAHRILEVFFDNKPDVDHVELDWHESASYIATCRSSGRRRAYPHLTVARGCVVSIIVSDELSNRSVVVQEADVDVGTMQFYAIYGVLSATNGDVWCAVRQLQNLGDGVSTRNSGSSVMKMGERVTRVGSVHVCSKDCIVDLDKLEVAHSETVLEGGIQKILTRCDVYPPHQG